MALVSARTGSDEGRLRFRAEEIRQGFGVGYAVTTADVNGNGRPDIVAINPSQLVWFENPGWRMHVLLDGQTPRDNVAIAVHDIDGDGRIDVAIGAGWNPRNTTSGGTLHWAGRPPDAGGPWQLTTIGEEPTLHRIRWADVTGDGRPELIAAPLHGRGTAPPDWRGAGARVLVFRMPPDPRRDSWPVEVADGSLHILHNVVTADLNGNGRHEILTASREGVHVLERHGDGRWQRRLIGEGSPGEIRIGRVGGRRVLGTIEPWHGHSVVIYTEAPGLWPRRVVEDGLAGGHALGWGDFDGDGDEELVVGWRDGNYGLAVYKLAGDGTLIRKVMVDEGGMATEDLAVADLDGDGRPDIVAVGRATGNVKIYWNHED